ncbi:MAG TPA: nucleotidyltransferase family protein [Bacteroidales bacterium]|nr:nucleotidyltransferase family protein [Bacteroidales bacterium]
MNAPGKINTEERLLLDLCRLETDDIRKTQITDLAKEVTRWDYFSTLAAMHGVAALVYYNLEKNNLLKYVPSGITDELKTAMLKSIGRNVFLTESLAEALNLLNSHNIKTVLLKGMALEKSIYGNRGLRQMNDIDILVERWKCLKARSILMNKGFTSLPVKSVLHKLILDRIGKHLPSLIKNGASIEIHHELFTDRLHSLTGKIIDSSKEVSVNGEKAFIPHPQLFFLYLIRHLEKHEANNESQLRLYTDLIVMLEKYSGLIINHDFLHLVSDAGMKSVMAGHLYSLQEFWSVEFPGWLRSFIKNNNPSDTTECFLFFLRSPKNDLTNRHGIYSQVVKEIPGVHRKIIFVLGDIFPTLTFMKKRYKCSGNLKAVLYYPHRLGKLWWLIHRKGTDRV